MPYASSLSTHNDPGVAVAEALGAAGWGGVGEAAERVGRRRRVGAKDFVCLRV